jgi:hypothetical protein
MDEGSERNTGARRSNLANGKDGIQKNGQKLATSFNDFF